MEKKFESRLKIAVVLIYTRKVRHLISFFFLSYDSFMTGPIRQLVLCNGSRNEWLPVKHPDIQRVWIQWAKVTVSRYLWLEVNQQVKTKQNKLTQRSDCFRKLFLQWCEAFSLLLFCRVSPGGRVVAEQIVVHRTVWPCRSRKVKITIKLQCGSYQLLTVKYTIHLLYDFSAYYVNFKSIVFSFQFCTAISMIQVLPGNAW